MVTGVTLGWFFWCFSCHWLLASRTDRWRVACWQTWFCQPICGLLPLPLRSPQTFGFAIQGGLSRTPSRPTELARHIGHSTVWVHRSHAITHTRRCPTEDYSSVLSHLLRPPFLGIFLAGFFIPRIINLLASVYVLHVCGWELLVVFGFLQSLGCLHQLVQ